jgi:hypothetical protein
MGIRLAPLTVFQIGREAVPGTAVAAAAAGGLAIPTMDFDGTDEMVRPQFARGYLIGNTGSEFVANRGVKWSIPEHPLNFQQVLHWLLMSIGTITNPVASPTGVYTWDWSRALLPGTVPIPDAFTFERRISDGTNFTDAEWSYATCTDWTIAGKPSGELGMSVNGFARRRQNSTLTPGINPQAVLNAVNSRVKVYINSTYATIGTTAIAGQVLDWSLTFESGFKPGYTTDNRADQDFTIVLFDPRSTHFHLKLKMLVLTQWAAELALGEQIGSQSLAGIRYIRIEITHPTEIVTGSAYLLRFDMVAITDKASMTQLSEQDGQMIFDASFSETANGVNPWFACRLVTGTAGTTI